MPAQLPSEPLSEHTDLVRGVDGWYRPAWAYADAQMLRYFDTEWGRPTHVVPEIFEILSLELLQAGLSWHIVLRKRAALRAAFAGFDPHQVASYQEEQIQHLLQQPQLIRHERKLRAIVNNAQCILRLEETTAGFSTWLWSFAPQEHRRPHTFAATPTQPESAHRLAKALKTHGFQWLGPTTCYAAMQAMGMVNDRPLGCRPLVTATTPPRG